MNYLEVLAELHALLRPELYLEIGVANGDSLALSNTRSIAIDPAFSLKTDVIGDKPWIKFYRETSDQFFATHQKDAVLEGNKIGLAFIDGLHLFEHVYRDLGNIEKWSDKRTIVAIHDVLFPTWEWATRENRTGAWTGDVWRIVPCLAKYRPDLSIVLLKTSDTGLLIVSNLDRKSRALWKNQEEALAEFLGDPRPYECQATEYVSTASPIDPATWFGRIRRSIVV